LHIPSFRPPTTHVHFSNSTNGKTVPINSTGFPHIQLIYTIFILKSQTQL
jgi:hypothetical protein